MVCTEYQERINDLALASFGAIGSDAATVAGANSGAVSDATLAQQIAECVGCRTELEQRRALLARIDSGVVAMVAVEPSPSLAVLVRQQIAEESGAASRSFDQRWGWWIGAAASAAAVAAIILAFALHGPTRPPAHSHSVAETPALPIPARPSPANSIGESSPTREIPGAIAAPKQPNLSARAPKINSQEAASVLVHEIESAAPSLEVLIPANQRIALVQLAAAGARNQLDERILVREAATSPPPAIEVKPLKIDLLSSLDSQVGDGSEKLY